MADNKKKAAHPVNQNVTISTSKTRANISHAHVEHKGQSTTKIIAHFDCGFPNNLFIRGDGISSLSWDKGVPMKNVAPNEWVWESDRPFSTAHFKILVNDNQFETGENHSLTFGEELNYSPLF